ncbi:DNA-binding response regulator [Methylosinus sp. R-45379]|uniref:response regulator transcription factor n=1 Tax=unclassified Methylosinus TaxID=2624500 RepID=UPI000465F155|nr:MULTISPECIES: DNA-binding response regulator [unclassified Methylosinus]OAI31040.1 DNA-binding response regulator [Methylosinus sp. R-45379]TDX63455.1 LuxR family two component transcriptional regulator [Methylosinus sp. sav-2]
MSADLRQRDTALVVDDNRDELSLLVEALERADFTALAATNGEAALALLERVTPNVVVLDAVMSGLDGFATCRRIKQNPRFAHLPVIFLTGLKDTSHVLMGLEAGGVDYVVKPVIIEELVARIRIHVSNAKAAFGARVALDATGRHLLATDRDGRLLWCTPQAADLLAARLGPFEILRSQPPEAFAALLREAAERRDHDASAAAGPVAISFLCEIGGDELLFRLTEPQSVSDEAFLAQKFALTLREAEVLSWLARGKSNHDIAEILCISPRTVHKHLERIFVKLGVDSRSSATSVALQTLKALAAD